MILADSSVWIDHLRHGSATLGELVEGDELLCHPFVIGELACGNLEKRDVTLQLLQTLPEAPILQHQEVLMFVERHRLMRSGIGWLDAHLLGSAFLAGAGLWTLDGPLARAAAKLSLPNRP